MPASEQYFKFNYFGQCKFGDKYQHQHIQETYTNQACNFNACRKRHSRLCRFFSQTGYCRFESSCSFLHKPGKVDTILEEVKKLEKDIAELKSHNSVLQKMLQYFNLFEKELKTLKEMMHNANSNIDAKNEKNTEKKETIENKKKLYLKHFLAKNVNSQLNQKLD